MCKAQGEIWHFFELMLRAHRLSRKYIPLAAEIGFNSTVSDAPNINQFKVLIYI